MPAANKRFNFVELASSVGVNRAEKCEIESFVSTDKFVTRFPPERSKKRSVFAKYYFEIF